MDAPLPINFANQVVPIFTKLGCNSGGCHGKISGQNGFRLSLLGFEPELDYDDLVKEGRGRRAVPRRPGREPAAAQGDRRRRPRRRQAAWSSAPTSTSSSAAGSPPACPTASRTTRPSPRSRVYPEHRILDRQQPAAVRRLRPLHRRHRRGRHPAGPVREQRHRDRRRRREPAWSARSSLTGEAAVMARYQGQVAVFRATVPLGRADARRTTFAAADRRRPAHRRRSGRSSGIVPVASCAPTSSSSAASTLDLTGTLPTPTQVHGVRRRQGRRRSATSWSTGCSRRRSTPTTSPTSGPTSCASSGGNQPDRAHGTFAFHAWIREAIAADKPYDEFVREILAAIGDETKSPADGVVQGGAARPSSSWTTSAQVFLGLRLACAQCHHHPYEKWSQDDYWGLAAFFGRVGRKNVPMPGRRTSNQQNQQQVIFIKADRQRARTSGPASRPR